jgi:hypothetical protein
MSIATVREMKKEAMLELEPPPLQTAYIPSTGRSTSSLKETTSYHLARVSRAEQLIYLITTYLLTYLVTTYLL